MVQVVRGYSKITHLQEINATRHTEKSRGCGLRTVISVHTSPKNLKNMLTENEEKLSNPPPGMEKQSPDQACLQLPNRYLLSETTTCS